MAVVSSWAGPPCMELEPRRRHLLWRADTARARQGLVASAPVLPCRAHTHYCVPATSHPARRSIGHSGAFQAPNKLVWALNLTRQDLPDALSPVYGEFAASAHQGGNVTNITLNGTGGACTLAPGCPAHIAPGAVNACNFSCTPGTVAASVSLAVDGTPVVSEDMAAQASRGAWEEARQEAACVPGTAAPGSEPPQVLGCAVDHCVARAACRNVG